MSTHRDNMEGWLAELGKARSNGAFSSTAGRYPWRKPEPKVIHLLHRRLAWARVAASFAVAAGVAVLFVAPSFFHRPGLNSIIPSVAGNPTPENAKIGPIAAAPVSPVAVLCGDYNGDGVVDGRDIQAFEDRMIRGGGGTPDDLAKSVEEFRVCLLGSK